MRMVFKSIKDVSQIRRMPRLGKIRLGIKAKNSKGVEYPTEVPYFVCPPEVRELYGDKPTELDILFPLESNEDVFPCAYKFFGSSRGVKCTGNGEVAQRMKDEAGKIWEEASCPCELLEQKKCARRGSLMVVLPKISMGGIYQIDTTSFNSIVDINSGLDYVRTLIGRVVGVPMKLKRLATETHFDGKKQIHYTLALRFEGNDQAIMALRERTNLVIESIKRLALEEPEEVNPAQDGEAAIPADQLPPEARGNNGDGEDGPPEAAGPPSKMSREVYRDADGFGNPPPPKQEPETHPPQGANPKPISKGGVKTFWDTCLAAGMSNDDVLDLLHKWRRSDGVEGGYVRPEDILPRDFNDIIATIKARGTA